MDQVLLGLMSPVSSQAFLCFLTDHNQCKPLWSLCLVPFLTFGPLLKPFFLPTIPFPGGYWFHFSRFSTRVFKKSFLNTIPTAVPRLVCPHLCIMPHWRPLLEHLQGPHISLPYSKPEPNSAPLQSILDISVPISYCPHCLSVGGFLLWHLNKNVKGWW